MATPSVIPRLNRPARWRVDVYAEIGTGYRQTRKHLWTTHCGTREQAEQAAARRAEREATSGWGRTHPKDNIAWSITSPDGHPVVPVELTANPIATFDFNIATGAKSPDQFTLTTAQQRLTLQTLEIVIYRLTQRAEVLAVEEVCNLLRASLGMKAVSYWDDSD
jgi:hypothetical protein